MSDPQLGKTFIFQEKHKKLLQDTYVSLKVTANEDKRKVLLSLFGRGKDHVAHLELEELEKRYAHLYLEW